MMPQFLTQLQNPEIHQMMTNPQVIDHYDYMKRVFVSFTIHFITKF